MIPTPPPDYPIAAWRVSPNFDRPSHWKVLAVVLHATAGEFRPSLDWLTSTQSQVSCHYLIDRDGATYQLVSESARAWHAGKSAYAGVRDWNDFSLGVELVNKNNGKDPYPQAQIDALVALLRSIVARHGVEREMIVTHAQIATPRGRKSDPRGLDVAAVLDRVYGTAQAA